MPGAFASLLAQERDTPSCRGDLDAGDGRYERIASGTPLLNRAFRDREAGAGQAESPKRTGTLIARQSRLQMSSAWLIMANEDEL